MASLIVRIDYECNADIWWDEFHHRSAESEDFGREFCYACSVLVGEGEVEITDPYMIRQFTRFVTSLPGWSDPSYNKDAPHPLILETE